MEVKMSLEEFDHLVIFFLDQILIERICWDIQANPFTVHVRSSIQKLKKRQEQKSRTSWISGENDELKKKYLEELGIWIHITPHLEGQTVDSCRDQYTNHLYNPEAGAEVKQKNEATANTKKEE